MRRRRRKRRFITYRSNPRWGSAQRLMRDDALLKFGTRRRERIALTCNISDERLKPKHSLNFMFLRVVTLPQHK